MSISSTEEIVAELRAGRMVILVDEEDRENEGDLVLAADFVTPEAINFMVKHARGLVCLTLTEERCDQLELSMMSARNGTAYGTNFTVSIEAAEGVTTGISAADRAKTIQVAVAKDAKPSDIVQPGHIFPLKAQKGGVLMRAGHTEAGCDLTAMAGLTPASVICEIMKDDGTMARLPDLLEFAKEHNLKIGTIADLIHYRSRNESLVEKVGERTLKTAHGDFRMIAYRDKPSGSAHLALVHGEIAEGQGNPGARAPAGVHPGRAGIGSHHPLVEPVVVDGGDQGGRQRRDRAAQLRRDCRAVLRPVRRPVQAGRAKPKGRAASMDLRSYGIGAQILREVGVCKMQLLASPRKMPSMTGFNLEVTGYVAKPN
jgi:3,4-dihydroxy 2-butanone 4-phosphate synthase/GTP cyclohydrolase II